MLKKNRCPYTGLINFFSDEEPYLSVGSVVKAGNRYAWRCYLMDRGAGGFATDLRTAERDLKNTYNIALVAEQLSLEERAAA